MKYTIKNNTCRHDWKILILLFLSALVLRCFRLFDLDVWFDEVVLLFQIKGSFADIWNYCKLDNFPPLFPWLMKLWSIIFPGENSLRFFSALMGSLTPPAAYILGKELLSKRLGLLLGIACLISVSCLFYSQMIRMYSLFPFWACLSLIAFIRGLKTNRWIYWILVACANLLGFYTFLFMLFLIAAEFIILIWYCRKNPGNLARPVLAHIPSVILMLFWLGPLVNRFNAIEQSFALLDVSGLDFLKLWVFLGTGTYFIDQYWLAALFNSPFLLGIVIGYRTWWRHDYLRIMAFLFFGIILSVYVISLLGDSIFQKRYFIFLLPVYLALVFAGWQQLKRRYWSNIGVAITLISMLISMIFYYVNYIQVHDRSGYSLPYYTGDESDGHALSHLASFVEKRVSNEEVIIHYSEPARRIQTFFPSLYYHDRALAEYIYSKAEIPHWDGGQYLKSKEWIRSLYDLEPLPSGIWMVSANSVEVFFGDRAEDQASLAQKRKWKWVITDNLPQELREAGYHPVEYYYFGNLTAVYLLRD